MSKTLQLYCCVNQTKSMYYTHHVLGALAKINEVQCNPHEVTRERSKDEGLGLLKALCPSGVSKFWQSIDGHGARGDGRGGRKWIGW